MDIGFPIFPRISRVELEHAISVLRQLPDAKIHLIADSTQPISTECDTLISATTLFAETPPLELLCVAGGSGVADAVMDERYLDAISELVARSLSIASLGLGAFILGAIGLLANRCATTQTAYSPLLDSVGAIYVPSDVVWDGNIVTGADVSARFFTEVTNLIGAEGTVSPDRAEVPHALDIRPQTTSQEDARSSTTTRDYVLQFERLRTALAMNSSGSN